MSRAVAAGVVDAWVATAERRRHMARFHRRDTAPELALRRELHRRGRRFFVDRRVSSRTRARPDLVFPRARVAVFVDGCFWHYCEQHAHLPKANAERWRTKLLANRQRDAQHDAVLVHEGWRVVRVWEHVDTRTAADAVEAALDAWDRVVRRTRSDGTPHREPADTAEHHGAGRPHTATPPEQVLVPRITTNEDSSTTGRRGDGVRHGSRGTG